jgi:ribosome-associated translation inhibitor RaiA
MAHHQPHDSKTPLPSSLPNPDQRPPGDPAVVSPPAHVRSIGVELTEDDHSYIRGKLLTKLAKFARSIQRVSVRVTDLNGPRGGIDQVCSIKVVLNGLPSVVVTRRHASVQAAIDAALHAMEQAVRGIVGSRRMKPLRSRSAGPHVDRF